MGVKLERENTMARQSSFFIIGTEAFSFLKEKYPIPYYLDNTGPDHIFIADLIKRFLPQGGRILDIGCGGMNKTAMMALLGYEMHAADNFEDPWHQRDNNLDKLKNFAREFDIILTAQDGSNYGLDYQEGFFDGVMINGVIEHLHESPKELLNNAGYWLREGGVFVCYYAKFRKLAQTS